MEESGSLLIWNLTEWRLRGDEKTPSSNSYDLEDLTAINLATRIRQTP